MSKKYLKLKSIHLGDRIITPIASLSVLSTHDIFYFVDYEMVAFKIKENEDVYYKNLSLTKTKLNKIKKIFED